METPHLYAVDLDGTLLDDAKEFDRAALGRVLDLLAAQGSYLVVATGNQLPKAQQYLAGFEEHPHLYFICENGAIIHHGGEDLALWSFSDEQVAQTLKILEGFPEVGIILSCRHNSYVPQDRLAMLTDRVYRQITAAGFDLPGYELDPLNAIRPFYPRVEGVEDPATITDAVVKIALNAEPGSDINGTVEAMRAALPAGLTATSSGFGAIDVIIEGNHKGHGVAWLARHLGIDGAATTAIGDSGNDLEMFQYAARAIAMEHSDPLLAPYTDMTIGTNQDGAVLTFLEAELTGQ
ncbi:HAD-IIB family hydrolase [Rothia nasimurium]|uniref:HAD-IIB family hydrolase n=1 Tax=Rothia nasimurium TaxID=85336 RepID=UPI003B9EF246